MDHTLGMKVLKAIKYLPPGSDILVIGSRDVGDVSKGMVFHDNGRLRRFSELEDLDDIGLVDEFESVFPTSGKRWGGYEVRIFGFQASPLSVFLVQDIS